MQKRLFSGLFSFLFLSVSVFAVSAAATEPTPEEYWSATALHFSDIFRTGVTNPQCAQSESYFYACYAALSAVSASMTPPMLLIPSSQLESRRAEYSVVYETFGPLSWVMQNTDYRRPTSGQGVAADFQAFNQARTLNREAVLRVFREQGATSVPFETILNHSSGQFPERSAEVMATVEALNAFFGVMVDPHTRISAIAADNADFSSSIENEVIGIGVMLNHQESRVFVESVMEGGPAQAVDVRAMDEVIRVNGVPVAHQTMERVSSMIRGRAGTRVRMVFSRSGRLLRKTITRAAVSVQNVTSQWISLRGFGVMMIRLHNFMDRQACVAIQTKIEEAEQGGAHALVLDLRNNPGGAVDQAQCIASLFLEPGKVVYSLRDLSGRLLDEGRTTAQRIRTALPMVTLINGGSASASEMLAGALQDHQRSWITGERSFGKGTAQASHRTGVEGVQMWQTFARFHQPSGRTNQVVGILPDFEITSVPNATADQRFALREGDIYLNAFGSQGTPWVQTRPDAVAAVANRCEGYLARAQQAFEGNSRQASTSDYALHASADLALCSAGL